MTHRRYIEPPPGLDPLIARFIEELARAAVERGGIMPAQPIQCQKSEPISAVTAAKKRRKRTMKSELPQIETVTVAGPSTLRIRWCGKRNADTVNLIGWIATGGDILAPLRDTAVFARAAVAAYGAAVFWDSDDLAIDALHLKKLTDEQQRTLK